MICYVSCDKLKKYNFGSSHKLKKKYSNLIKQLQKKKKKKKQKTNYTNFNILFYNFKNM